jgi:hypothetical protein
MARLTGLDLQMVWAGSAAHGPWRYARDYDDNHYDINVKTGEWKPDPDQWHTSSCPGHENYNPEEWERAEPIAD